ncbi:hypothetical protein COLO4_02812 [Corchorus olitorius]|uniref:SHSP domain-containing protein n=1 Tax=Corchorus olitorius TaxID=93759 RepID=A0A1R3L089_9ROSI|nr:hypothetical protein COLO4_02812 [Corchorus olitorius]
MALSRVFSRTKMLRPVINPIRSVHHVDVHADEAHIAPPTTQGHKCYPFLSSGSKETVFGKVYLGKGSYLRVDMPGVKQDGLKLTLKGATLFFEGTAHAEPEFDDFDDKGSERKFKGSMEYYPVENYSFDKIQSKISAGVLRVFVPFKNAGEFTIPGV